MKTILTAALLILISQPIWACESDECAILYQCSAEVQDLHTFIRGSDPDDKTPVHPRKGTSEIRRSLRVAVLESFKNASMHSLLMCDLDEKISDEESKIKMSDKWEADAGCSYSCTEESE